MSSIIWIVAIVAFVFLMRLLGAWMLRINEIIELLQTIAKQLHQLNNPSKTIK